MKWLYLSFALWMLLLNWGLPSSLAEQSVAAIGEVPETTTNTIPDEAIRLRILANTDSVHDQWVKRQVRDRIVEHVTKWANELDSQAQARERIKERLPELEEIVRQELERLDAGYTAKVDFGMVPFPTKLYGNDLYPAGEYEALRISLGDAEGQNWWCVLFPPLCFVDFTSASDADVEAGTNAAASNESSSSASASAGQKVEIEFFLWEWLQSLWA
jgi:stage II sporulation protein R